MITSSASPTSEPIAVRAVLACVILLTAAFAFGAARTSAEGAVPAEDIVQLRARFERLSTGEGAANAEGAIEQARRALDLAKGSADDPEKRERARETAHAAIVLGERQLHLRAVQAELIATQRRLTTVRERAGAQRRVLEALMRERASLARGGGEP